MESNVARCPLFVDMTLDERQQVLVLLEHEHYTAGETVLREGLSTQNLWIVTHGQCEVIKARKDGTEKQLAVLDAGAVFGEMSFFHSAPHSATVRTLTTVDVMRLSREQFDSLCETGASAALKIAMSTAGVIAERLRCMDDWTRDLIQQVTVSGQKEEWQEFRAKLYTDWQF
jgi:CRP/FNR family transcriptional regulator/CRP/FNR family cyclic AMP-dependent transcriptional regulator